MKHLFFLLSLLISLGSQAQYWQQRADYRIDVALNEAEKTLDGFARITYTNHSPDTLRFIWFHLWPNAYKNDRTAYSEQAVRTLGTDFYFSKKEERGYINRLDFKVDGSTARTEDHPTHIDIVKLLLPAPLGPGKQVVITTPFHVKLPYNFSRGGYVGNSFQVTQWYPKPAVYDRKGWHPMPYLDQGEFYSEFGDYEVRITVPKSFIVAATGELQNEEERMMLESFQKPERKPVAKSATKKPGTSTAPRPQEPVKTLEYVQKNVHDFAWFANRDFLVDHDTLQLPSGKQVRLYSFYTPAQAEVWKSSTRFAKQALRYYSERVGEYPYSTASVVQGPQGFGGGMEYPTITSIAPTADAEMLDEVIAHELGHNWFYGILASNERIHPFMDEGFNSYYEYGYMRTHYGKQQGGQEAVFQTKAQWGTDQPISDSSEAFTESNYGLVAYHKTAQWLQLTESRMGRDSFDRMMQDYYETWKFKHPYPQDYFDVLRKWTPAADELEALTRKKGVLPGFEPKGFAFVSPLKKNSIRNFLQQPARDLLFVSPSLGVNKYDGLMLGALIGNYKLPPNRFSWFLAPMYGLGSKKLTGIAKLNYSATGRRWIRKTDVFLNAATFSIDDFRDTADRKLIFGMKKLVPGFRLNFRPSSVQSTVRSFLQWKTFLLEEESLRITPDTLFNGADTALIKRYSKPKSQRYLNQLRFVLEDHRALYPYSFAFQVEQGAQFVRPTFTAHYFFNYRGGGLRTRLFAGSFHYLKTRTINRQFATDRYHLNMTGPNGYEDYTYSDYFVGRNEFEGLASQQIMERDGFFKVRTDLLASKIGKTDRWLTAINLDASLPQKLNPLSVLPIKIPVHLFFDLGTYAEAWKQNAELDRFLFDFGVHLPLLNGAFDLYFPILYNRAYSDYIKSVIPKNRFLKSMSFTIHLNLESIKKLNRELEL